MIIKITSQVGNPVIRAKALSVASVHSKATQRIVKNLTDSMRHHGLVGMAAPQIGVSKKIFVTEVRKTKHRSPNILDGLRVFINPKIVSSSKRNKAGYEGCGSVAFAKLFGKVMRPEAVTVQAYNEKGEKFEIKATGLLARIIQHEIDHLNGVVFLDRLTDKKSLMSENEYRKKFKK